MDLENVDYLVVGCGFYGVVLAERIASELGKKVLVVDKRSHIGGNSYSEVDPESGVEYHKYGSHIFHTSNERVWQYINRFTEFNGYRHRVFTTYQGRVYSMPINLGTINSYYGKAMSPGEAKAFLEAEIARDRIENPSNLEDKAISLIGRPLYEAFIRGYTAKQWETDLRKLPPGIITRLPVRFDYNDRYFADTYEGIPLHGYAQIFRRMLENPNIEVRLNTDFFDIRKSISPKTKIIYTGPLDRFFDYRHGTLGWRTIRLEREVVAVDDYQGTSVMNYADQDVPFTRIHEFRHFHPERKISSGKSLIFREYSKFATKEEDPYYPINTEEDKRVLKLYQEEVARTSNVIFGGRLGSYKYYDMHQAIGAALLTYERDVRPQVTGQAWVPQTSKDLLNF
jgi:UDP-galactopyranose mutase